MNHCSSRCSRRLGHSYHRPLVVFVASVAGATPGISGSVLTSLAATIVYFRAGVAEEATADRGMVTIFVLTLK